MSQKRILGKEFKFIFTNGLSELFDRHGKCFKYIMHFVSLIKKNKRLSHQVMNQFALLLLLLLFCKSSALDIICVINNASILMYTMPFCLILL